VRVCNSERNYSKKHVNQDSDIGLEIFRGLRGPNGLIANQRDKIILVISPTGNLTHPKGNEAKQFSATEYIARAGQ
jgi:hypothetical protein